MASGSVLAGRRPSEVAPNGVPEIASSSARRARISGVNLPEADFPGPVMGGAPVSDS